MATLYHLEFLKKHLHSILTKKYKEWATKMIWGQTRAILNENNETRELIPS